MNARFNPNNDAVYDEAHVQFCEQFLVALGSVPPEAVRCVLMYPRLVQAKWIEIHDEMVESGMIEAMLDSGITETGILMYEMFSASMRLLA